MRTTQLNANTPDRPQERERSLAATIAGEWAELSIELCDEMGDAKAGLFIVRIGQLWVDDPRAMRLVLRLLTGNLTEITRSYSEQSQDHDRRSKQAVQQELEVLLAKIGRRFPELASAIAQLRCVKADWKANVV